jgi:hypothetical protein
MKFIFFSIYEYLSEDLHEDIDIILTLIKYNHTIISKLSKKYTQSKEFMIKAIEYNGD